VGSRRAWWRALVFVPAVLSGAGAAQLDLLHFVPTEPGAQFTLRGTAYVSGATHPGTYTLKVDSFERLGRESTLHTSDELVAGPHRLSASDEIAIDHRGFRPVKSENQGGKQRRLRLYGECASVRPRFVAIGRTYPIRHQFKIGLTSITVTGTERFLIEPVETPLGTFECLRLSGSYEQIADEEKKVFRRLYVDEWYARGFGLVRGKYIVSSDDDMLEFDGTLSATSRALAFQPVVPADK
jgi:hypothetical protein